MQLEEISCAFLICFSLTRAFSFFAQLFWLTILSLRFFFQITRVNNIRVTLTKGMENDLFLFINLEYKKNTTRSDDIIFLDEKIYQLIFNISMKINLISHFIQMIDRIHLTYTFNQNSSLTKTKTMEEKKKKRRRKKDSCSYWVYRTWRDCFEHVKYILISRWKHSMKY